MADETDVVVIGLGPGGEDVAGRLAEAGLDVTGVERELVGGECPYWGCVPSKMAIRAANLLAEARRIDGIAGKSTVEPDWAPVARRIRAEATDNWDDKVAVERFVGKGGHFIRGEGRITAPDRVQVGDTELVARRGIVVASGTSPVIPPIPGLEGTPYWTNREALAAETLPGSLIVLGGGAIGLEMAQVFARFGVEVTIIEAEDRLIPREEPEAGELLASVLEAEGLRVRTGARAERVDHAEERFRVALSTGTSIDAEKLLVSVGRRANPAAVGLTAVGVAEDATAAPVDEHLRVAPGVWAVGDVTGIGQFTHLAAYHAPIAVADILGIDAPAADYTGLSRVTFTDPEVGAAGLTEAEARARGLDVRTGSAEVQFSARGWIHKAGNDGFVKLVEDADRGVLVGGTSAGPAGGEVLGLLTLAVHAAVPTETMAGMIYAYPTFHRAVEDALRDLRQAH